MKNIIKICEEIHVVILKICLLVILIMLLSIAWFYYKKPINTVVRIGYFNGFRTNMIFRTYLYDFFDRENLKVKLYSKSLKETSFFEVKKNKKAFKSDTKSDNLGKVTGAEIIDKILSGELDGGTVGESSFVQAINNDLPIVGVAWLGYDKAPGRGIILRSGLKIDSADDLKGKTFITHRAGPAEAMFLREFFYSVSLDPDKDVKIIDQVNELDAEDWLRIGKVDGGMYHPVTIKKLIKEGVAQMFRPMDWMDHELSFAILVFHKDFIEKHRAEVEKFVVAYIKRIKYEKDLPPEKKYLSWNTALMMEGEFEGIGIAYYDYPPYIKINKLYQVQDLLIKYGFIKQRARIEDYIDTSFVKGVD